MRFSLGAVATFRGRRVRSCGYKQKHWTIQGAGAHLDSIRRRFGAGDDSPHGVSLPPLWRVACGTSEALEQREGGRSPMK